MTGFFSALLLLAKPLVGRVLLALGFSVLTITGVAAVFVSMKGQIVTLFGAADLPLLQLAGLAGCWTGLGMFFGSVTFAVTMFGLRKAVSMVGVAGV